MRLSTDRIVDGLNNLFAIFLDRYEEICIKEMENSTYALSDRGKKAHLRAESLTRDAIEELKTHIRHFLCKKLSFFVAFLVAPCFLFSVKRNYVWNSILQLMISV